ncbi:hypothetical protein LWC35_02250 [Pseudonocardia kujensis]|uniref:hypothetical protein n=1 Tax=Pseudonocardia kujensis TaxID=1128675 RepID=UPI001E313215|nr:hypothetical protein [Pseudonocardia kujensis]MCE0761741.1 hypothetical protein [Pseudonocardia kujensis]
MSLQPTWTLPDDSPTVRLPFQRPAHRAVRVARRTRGPRTWAESAARRRRRIRRARFGRLLLVLVALAALTGAAVIWQLADGRPLHLLRDGWALLEPHVDEVVRLIRRQ